MCHIRNWLLNLGIVLLIVPLTLKTWRLHRIFNRSKQDALKTVVIPDLWLMGVLSIFFLYDVIVLAAWWGAKPFSVWELIGRCDSAAEPYIHAVLWWWKPLVLIYLAYLVYNVRDIDERFNESWWIGVGLYNVAVSIALFAILTYTLDLPPRQWGIMFVTVIIYLGLSSFGLLFLVKFYYVYYKKHENERMLGTEVAADIADAEEVIEEEKVEEKQEERDKSKGKDPDSGDEALANLHKKREKKSP